MWRHDEEFNTQTQRKRVRIHHNGDFENGKDLLVEPDWNIKDFLNACSLRLGTSSHKRVFNSDGHDIDDCMMIEDNDILFLSNGDDFIPPGADGGSVLYLKNGNTWETIPTIISGYKIGKLLGRGGFGEVRMGEHQLTKEKVALKFLRKAEIMSMGAAERTTTEIQCLSALRHAHIIRLTQHVESPHHVVLVFELMEGGDLYNYLLNRQIDAIKASTESISSFQYALPEDEARHVFSQVVSAIGYAHNQHICHRDLKLENILLKSTNLSCIKIADFGLSAFYRPGAHMKSSCGTLSFLAPEVFAGTSNAGPPLDVWALGVILFAILCGRLPFEGPDLAGTKRPRDAVIRSRISKGQYKIEEGLSPEAKDLVRRMLRVDPSIRATVPEIFSHVWMRSSSQAYDPYNPTTSVKDRELMSPLSLIQKLSLNSPPPVPLTPPPAVIEKTNTATDSRISTPRSSLKLPIIATPTTGVEEDGDHDDIITRKSSSETELDNLPVFDADRALNKLRSNSTDDSMDDVIETVSTGRRSSAKPDISEPDENSHCASPKSSLVLVPLRRNPQSGSKDIIPSPRRPKTAIDDDDFLTKFRAESWDILQDDLPSTAASTARGRGSIVAEGESHTRLRQSTGSLSARLHPLQLRKQEHSNNNNNGNNDGTLSNSNSTTSSPSAGVHTGRSYNSSRKTLVQSNNTGTSSSTTTTATSWTEQLEETKEILAVESTYLNGGSGKHSKNTDSIKGSNNNNNNQTSNDHTNNNNNNNNTNQSRSKHSQLHLAGSSSLKPHSVSITVTSSSSQPSTPQQTIRRKIPSGSSSSSTPHRSSFTSSTQSANDRSPPSNMGINGQGSNLVTGTSYTNVNFLSSTKRNSVRSGSSGSGRLTKIGGEITVDQSSSKNLRSNERGVVDNDSW